MLAFEIIESNENTITSAIRTTTIHSTDKIWIHIICSAADRTIPEWNEFITMCIINVFASICDHIRRDAMIQCFIPPFRLFRILILEIVSCGYFWHVYNDIKMRTLSVGIMCALIFIR